jgi:hypothetical protein
MIGSSEAAIRSGEEAAIRSGEEGEEDVLAALLSADREAFLRSLKTLYEFFRAS